MNNLLLVGYYGFSNFGDDLILETFLRNFSSEKTRIWLLTWRRYPDLGHQVRQIFRYDIFSILSLFLSHKSLKIVFPGGEVFQSRTSRRSNLVYGFFIFLAKIFRKPFYLLFQGFHPETMDLVTAKKCRSFFREADYACIRDHDKEWISKEFGSSTIEPCADLSLQYDLSSWKQIVPQRRFLFALKPAHQEEMMSLHAIIEKLADEYSSYVFLFLSCHQGKDSNISRRLINHLRLVKPSDNPGRFLLSMGNNVANVIDLIASSEYVFSMRYHPALMAMRFGRPCIVFGDDPRLAPFKASDF